MWKHFHDDWSQIPAKRTKTKAEVTQNLNMSEGSTAVYNTSSAYIDRQNSWAFTANIT
jgi:hypothetical protein